MLHALAWACAAVAAIGLLMECLNLADFPRIRPDPNARVRVNAYVAMRDEAQNVEAFLDATLADLNVDRIVVANDASGDRTFDAARAYEARDARVRAVDVPAGAPGVSGKCRAIAYAVASVPPDAPYVLFLDADVRIAPGCTSALIERSRAADAAAVTVWPRVECPTVWSALAAPCVTLFLLQALPMAAARGTDPRFRAGNGQCFLVERDAYARAGGHAALSSVVEDVALAGALKRAGERVALGSAAGVAVVRGYGSLLENARGYGRSLYFGTGAPGCVAVACWQLAAFVAPLFLLSAEPPAAAAGIACGFCARAIAALVMRERAWTVFIYPLSALLIAFIAMYAAVEGARGALSWRSRALGKRSRTAAANEAPR